MSWAQPHLFWLLILPLALGLSSWVRRGVAVPLPADHIPNLAPHACHWRRLFRALDLLPALLATVVVLLLAGPQRPAPPAVRPALTNIDLCLDVSGSMTSTVPSGATRFDAAMDAIALFARARPGDAFGLTIFGNQVLRWLPLTTDLDALVRSRAWLRPESLPSGFGGTEIGKGMRASIATLRRQDPSGDRMLILLSDGHSSDLDPATTQAIAGELQEARIVFFMVFIGDCAPQAELETFAQATGGRVFTASDPAGLGACFAAIDRLRPVRIEQAEVTMRPWRRPWLLLLVVLGAVQFLCAFGLRRTPW